MNLKIGAAILVLLVLAIGAYWYRSGAKAPGTAGEVATTETDAASATEATTGTVASTQAAAAAPAKKAPSITPALSYAEAVALFGTRRIQFDEKCNVEPSPITFRSGVSVMLDNRSPEARTITLDDTEYRIPAFGFKILTLRSRVLPHTVRVDCGEGKNNGQIILQ